MPDKRGIPDAPAGPAAVRPDGIVVAGGAGRRLGMPKALALLEGRTLVERAVATLAGCCERVIVVVRDGIDLPPLEAEVVVDRPGPACVLGAVATGLAAATGGRALVLGCDLPFAAPAIDALLVAGADGAVVAAGDGRLQPLCALYPRAAALAVAQALLAAGDLRATGLPEALSASLVEDRWEALTNVNTAADLEGARARAACGITP